MRCVFDNVSKFLGALPGDGSRETMIRAKYYYAGGCCRYMFGYTTDQVKIKLNAAVDSLGDVSTVASAAHRSPATVNRLFAMFKRGSQDTVSSVISQYAATHIGVKSGPTAIQFFKTLQRENSNAALDGWMLEMLFFARIRKGGLRVSDRPGIEEFWAEARIIVSDSISFLSEDETVWITPETSNQGGYDAVMVCKRSQHVRFVQVTRAKEHSLRIDCVHSWLDMFMKSPESFEIKRFEVVFVVEQNRLATFRFSAIIGSGLLTAFGWTKGREAEMVRVVGIQGLYEMSQ